MKPTLLILAAGMGSRYGGLKQIDGVGPNGEAIIEYSIYDAIRAGFGKVVFVIRESIEADFKAYFANKFQDKIEIAYVYQEITNVPDGVPYHPERQKPWGTGHAVLMGESAINEPFAMVNADDFYGAIAFQQMADYLKSMPEQEHPPYCIVGYKLNNTLSKHGSVSRGECKFDENNLLISVTERTKIQRNETGEIAYTDSEGTDHILAEDTIVSMNMIGFAPNAFDHLNHYFKSFLEQRGQELKSEYYIPTLLSQVIQDNKESVKVITTDASWFGVTYKEDRSFVEENVGQLVQQGVYPANLWS
ncbi:MAG: sugar phosphate nucleotidyltransferase [Bacteroidota bacterium]